MRRSTTLPIRFAFVAMVCVLGGSALVGADGARTVGDPVKGKKLFSTRCVACHRPDGRGGVKVTGNPTPDFRDAALMAQPAHSDSVLRDCITNGRPKSGMVAWSKQGVKPADIEHLIAYIRTFAVRDSTKPKR